MYSSVSQFSKNCDYLARRASGNVAGKFRSRLYRVAVAEHIAYGEQSWAVSLLLQHRIAYGENKNLCKFV